MMHENTLMSLVHYVSAMVYVALECNGLNALTQQIKKLKSKVKSL